MNGLTGMPRVAFSHSLGNATAQLPADRNSPSTRLTATLIESNQRVAR